MSRLTPFISLTSDFGVQTQGVGLMEATARVIAPHATVLHLMHGLPSFDTLAAARTLESVRYLPTGAHVCVCDPGVGSDRKAIMIQAARGDVLVGPDNGVLIPAARILGGIRHVHQITNPNYMQHPVSPIFHGRDVFVPAAAHAVNGNDLASFGPALSETELVVASYTEAIFDGVGFESTVIQINKFGSLHLNILHSAWDAVAPAKARHVVLSWTGVGKIVVPIVEKFADVPVGEPLILKDDYGRIELAVNLGSFSQQFKFQIGDRLRVDLGI